MSSNPTHTSETNSPNVLHVIPALFGRDGGVVGGAERYAFELARNIAELTPTRLISFGPQDTTRINGKLETRVIGSPRYIKGQSGNPYHGRVFSEARWADVIHCHQQHILVSSLLALYCRLTRRKIVVSDLGGGGWDISSYISTDRWYQAHLHISEYSRKIFGHAERSWAKVIMGGVDTVKFHPSTSPIPHDQRRVLFVGRVLPHKGVNDLIQGLPEGLGLDVVGHEGDTRFRDDLRKLAEGKDVRFLTDLDDSQLMEMYRNALCIALPSVYKTMYGDTTKVPELLGQTLLEGMACGIPAICTDVASMPEIVIDGETGYVTPPNNPTEMKKRLQKLKEDPTLCRSMGEAGRNRVLEVFTWSEVAHRCLKIYNDPRQ